jgi:hypothetical protein
LQFLKGCVDALVEKSITKTNSKSKVERLLINEFKISIKRFTEPQSSGPNTHYSKGKTDMIHFINSNVGKL